MKDEIRKLDPPSPNPHRCMQVGAATAKIMADSPWRVALMASSSWSHSFLTEKNWQLWPADRAPYDALETGDYAKWHAYKTDQIEESGQHEVLIVGREDRCAGRDEGRCAGQKELRLAVSVNF